MKIAIITGSRSDWNALEMVRRVLVKDHEIVWCDLDAPAKKIGVELPLLNVQHAVNTVGMLVSWRPEIPRSDLAIMHGDRHEILGAAVAANVMGVPIAHIGGGDLTEGSQDDCFRHAITKLSHLHFASNQDSADRIVQMGEQPDRVHVTGDPGIDMVVQTPLLTREQTFAAVELPVCDRMLLVSFHPNTMGDTRTELVALGNALEEREEAIVFIGPNADAGSEMIREEWRVISRNRKNTVYHDNLEPQVFYSLMNCCDVMVGNSSAGFYEAPCFDTKVIDIGHRQDGRRNAGRMIRLMADEYDAISRWIDIGVSGQGWGYDTSLKGYYGDGHAAERIARIIGSIEDPAGLLRKRFHELAYLSDPPLQLIEPRPGIPGIPLIERTLR